MSARRCSWPDAPVLDDKSVYLSEVAKVSRDERAAELQHGRGDAKIHRTHREPSVTQGLEAVDARFIERQDPQIRQRFNARGQLRVRPRQFRLRLGFAKHRVPAGELFLDRDDADGQVIRIVQGNVVADGRMSFLMERQRVRVEDKELPGRRSSSSL